MIDLFKHVDTIILFVYAYDTESDKLCRGYL